MMRTASFRRFSSDWIGSNVTGKAAHDRILAAVCSLLLFMKRESR